RTEVSDQVGDRPIDLMPDRRDHRYSAQPYRTRKQLVIKRPQVLRRTAASPDDKHVDPLVYFQTVVEYIEVNDSLSDAVRRAFALNERRCKHYANRPSPPRQDIQ